MRTTLALQHPVIKSCGKRHSTFNTHQTMSASFSITQMTASKLLKPSATIYMIGNIKEGHLQNNTAAYCKWEIISNEKNWIINKGNPCGQTWVAETSKDYKCLWTHPFDIEFRCKSMSGAPKLYVEVYSNSSINKTTDFCLVIFIYFHRIINFFLILS